MNRDHHQQRVDQILDQAPRFWLNDRASSKIVKEIYNEAEMAEKSLQKKFHRFKLAATASLTFGLLLMFIVVTVSHYMNTGSTELDQPREEWGISSIYMELINGLEWKYVGEEKKYGLLLVDKTVTIEDVQTARFKEHTMYQLTWMLFNADNVNEDSKMDVIARNQTTGEQFQLVNGADIPQSNGNEDFLFISTLCDERKGCVFPSDGKWKLSIYINDDPLGDINIYVLKRTPQEIKSDKFYEDFRFQLVHEVVTAFNLDLEGYEHCLLYTSPSPRD